MERKNYVLISDGSSDRCLLPIIDYWLSKYFPEVIFQGENAVFRTSQPKTLADKIKEAIVQYEPDWIFVHRDAEKENEPLQKRAKEIEEAVGKVQPVQTIVKIIPIRMTEAWLLIDEKAIRRAAGNPNGKVRLEIPKVSQLEQIANPKELLSQLLRQASELSGRSLAKLNVDKARHLVAEHTQNYELLSQLSAVKHFQRQLEAFQ
ncbi:MAG: DUF4276 family protein [Spirosomaceae bacterium]|jgi:hypothetical protein|nr:DUF4276 family protein [Spirosomataceae bacterium]